MSTPAELLNLEMAPFLRQPPLYAEASRALCAEDKVLLGTVSLGVKPIALTRIRAIHHQAAKLLATGMKAVEVSAVVGLSQNRLSILQSDSAFKELLSFYTEREDTRFADAQERLVLLGLDAAAELHERIVENPEEVSSKTLVEIMTASLDRSGHSPVHKHAFTFLSKDDISKIKEAAPISVIRSRHEPVPPKTLPSDSGPAVGGPIYEVSPPDQAKEADRSQGQGGAV